LVFFVCFVDGYCLGFDGGSGFGGAEGGSGGLVEGEDFSSEDGVEAAFELFFEFVPPFVSGLPPL